MGERIVIGYDASVTLAPIPGGIARYALELLRGLVELGEPGVEFVVLLNSWRHEPGARHQFLFSAPNVRVVRRKIPGPMLVEGWRRLGAPSWETLVDAECAVVHAPANYVPPARCPVVATIHDLGFLRDGEEQAMLAGGYFQKSFPEQLPKLDAIICPSRFVAEDLLATYALDAGRVQAVHSGIDGGMFCPGAGLSEEERSVLRIVKPFVLAVTADVSRKRPDWIPQIAGRIARKCGLQTVAVGLPESLASSEVIRVGGLEDERLVRLYRSARAVMLTTREEGFGFPLLEGMACGTPVVCGRHSSLAEIGGTHPVYTESDVPDAFVEALAGIDEQHPDAESRRAASDWARGYTWRACAEQVMGLYRRLAAG